MRALPCAVALTAATCLVAPLDAQTQDTVVLRSGNPVIGEIKSLKRGKLEVHTEAMDLVKIDWDAIASLVSHQSFRIVRAGGRDYFGSIAAADTASLAVVGAVTDTVPLAQIVAITPVQHGFWARTNGYVDVGTNLARANRVRSLSVKGVFAYRGPVWGLDLSGEAYWQRQETVDPAGAVLTASTTRKSAAALVSRLLSARWGAVTSLKVEQNEELDLEERVLGALGLGRDFIRNPGVELTGLVGVTINRERFVGRPEVSSGEVLAHVGFDAFDVGPVDVYASVTTFTNPAQGRFRMNADARIAWEIVEDLTVGVTMAERYDSAPRSATAPTRDYQYGLVIGWSWR